MNLEEALSIVDRLIHPQRLSTLQEKIFRECWTGKTYQQIAEDTDYDADYVRVVGSKLWQTLSDACDEKVTKNNFRSILRQQSKQQPLSGTSIELPDGPMSPTSPFYIERPPIEEICRQEIAKPGSLLRIKAVKNMGKKSLLRRILIDKEDKYHTVRLDFQQAETVILSEFNRLIRWIFANLCSNLKIENTIDDYWDEDLGIKVSCTTYMQDYILEQLDKPLILALDKLHQVFEYEETAQEFLPLLRFWHEEANNVAVWSKLRLIAIQSTESYVALSYNQSPFNVGLPVALPEFNREQMMDLAERHQLNWRNGVGEEYLTALMDLIGGYPYLARMAFYHLAKHDITITELIEEAATETSIYRNILRYYLSTLYETPHIATSFKQVINSPNPIQLESIAAYRLESLGLIHLDGNEASPSCELYRRYFKDRLNQF